MLLQILLCQANALPQHLSTTENPRGAGVSVQIHKELSLFLARLWKGAGISCVQQIPSCAGKSGSVMSIEPSLGKFI